MSLAGVTGMSASPKSNEEQCNIIKTIPKGEQPVIPSYGF